MVPLTGPLTVPIINAELARAANAAFSMNDALTRALAGKTTGPISFSDFRGNFLIKGIDSGTEAFGQSVIPQVIDGETFFAASQTPVGSDVVYSMAFLAAPTWQGNYRLTNAVNGTSVVLLPNGGEPGGDGTSWSLDVPAAGAPVIVQGGGLIYGFSIAHA